MKVLYILSSSSTFGGSTKSFLRMFFELRKKGLDMQVVCPDKGPAYNILQKEGITTYVVPTRFHTYPQYTNLKNIALFIPRLINHYYINQKAYSRIRSICLQEKFDVIHTNVSVVNVGERVARNLKIPHIYHIREYQDRDFGMKMMPTRGKHIEQLQQNHCICITKDIHKHFCLDYDNSAVIYNGVKSKDNLVYNPSKEEYFFFVGRVDPNKGFETVLQAFTEYHKKDHSHKLYVAGMFISKDFENKTKSFVNSRGLSDHVLFLGLRSDVDSLMQKAKACVIASPFEGFGLVMAEAMFNGCLVIAKSSCGTKEQLENAISLGYGKIALSFDNTNELTELMLDVCKNASSYFKDMIESSQQVVASLYTIEHNADRVYSFYQKILQLK